MKPICCLQHFYLPFWFFKNCEITETGNVSDNHVIKISDIKFEGNNLNVTNHQCLVETLNRILIALQHTYFRIYLSVILK
jgi:hypothetical protein